MSNEDRVKWNDRFRRGDHTSAKPSPLLTGLAHLLPPLGRALDVAGGAGRHAIWLAQTGFETTLADISPVGLDLARQRAEQAGVVVQTCAVDLEEEPFPAGPWDVIVVCCFLRRALFAEFRRMLSPNGLLLVLQPTKSNLERHPKPPADFLLEDGEAPALITGLEIVHYEEGWLAEGRHDALLAARKPLNAPSDSPLPAST